ncbi:MAG: hypothetical protein ACRDRH_21385 [Pseudonocardia sp.]
MDQIRFHVRRSTERLPEHTAGQRWAREQALRAVEIVSEALDIDPTLADPADPDRIRGLDLVTEILRQLGPLSNLAALAERHAVLLGERARTGDPDGRVHRELATLGRVNPAASEELAALAERVVVLAQQVRDIAEPDWASPTRTQQRSARLLPEPDRITGLAAELERLLGPALAVTHPAPAALHLAALARHLHAAAVSAGRRPAPPGPATTLRWSRLRGTTADHDHWSATPLLRTNLPPTSPPQQSSRSFLDTISIHGGAPVTNVPQTRGY